MRPDGQLVTLQEAADRLGVHYMTAYRYVRLGRLPAVKVDAQWQVPVEALEAWVAKGPQERGARGRPRVAVHRERLLSRLLANDERGAWGVVESAMIAGLEPADVHLSLLGPAMREVGERWASGAISVADEHRATAVAVRLVGRLGPSFVRPGRRRGTIVTGVAPGDAHALPAALLSDVLRAAQYSVVELGGDTPVDSFAHAVTGVDRLVAVCISFSVSGRDDEVRAAVAAVRDAAPGIPVFVGGPACEGPEHAAALGADGSAPDARALVAALA